MVKKQAMVRGKKQLDRLAGKQLTRMVKLGEHVEALIRRTVAHVKVIDTIKAGEVGECDKPSVKEPLTPASSSFQRDYQSNQADTMETDPSGGPSGPTGTPASREIKCLLCSKLKPRVQEASAE